MFESLQDPLTSLQLSYIHSCLHATSKTTMADFQYAAFILSFISKDVLNKDTSTLESCSPLKTIMN